ncbi:MAG: hypoxanthine phosphoribosyltransferase [bacterium]|nr:hypoxanthine phosphoribosyltransferase [bacterium]
MPTLSDEKRSSQPFEILLDQTTLAKRVTELGKQITKDYAGRKPLLVGVLKGCVVFMSDLMRHIELPLEAEFIFAASYRNGIKREDDVILGGGIDVPIKGRDVLLVEGVVDSARTVSIILHKLRKQEPASLEIVTLLDKPASHRTKVEVKYRGFSIGNEFVIGYGLDNTQMYRNLPFVGRMIDR